MLYRDLDIPALLIDKERLEKNLADMQSYANNNKVKLRPHTKTHKMPEIAQMQLKAGACGMVHHETGAPLADNITQQTLDALHNVELVLDAAGLRKENVIMCHVYIPKVEYWDEVNAAYAKFFGAHKPARVVVPSRELHGGALVEIEAMAEMSNLK
ncbi:MAG: hypothetical protein E7197_07905 [Anaerovibrio sp.]|uniref:RidA family protein n=1 Tax=Anaerovibrio sp. TaxID=1872532 RepID=UPI0025C66DC9|nr:Rid family hydrolase [Anaerovibrio sp.]MBE6099964.1 hypothetical protein [Anaerovibrio sp.]